MPTVCKFLVATAKLLERRAYVEAYHTLFSGTGVHFLNEDNSISRDDYSRGFFLLILFPIYPLIAPDIGISKHGSLRLEVRFEKPLTLTTHNCIVYAEFDVLEIDSSHQVIVDSSG